MPPRLFRSNEPVSDDCKARLLRLRASQLLELDSIKLAIEVDNESIADIKKTIGHFEETIARSKAALAVFNANMNALKESRSRLLVLSSAYNKSSTLVERDEFLTCRRAHALIAASGSSESKHVDEQQNHLQARVLDLQSMLSSLERELYDYIVELTLGESSLTAHTTFMRAILSTLGMIKQSLSPIRQVPSELWEEIFRIVATRLDGNADQIMSISRVCKKWRTITMDCTRFWTRVVIPAAPWWPQVETHRLKKLLSLSGENHTTFLIILQEQRKWETQALASEKIGQLYLHDEHSFFEPQPEIGYKKKLRPLQKFKPTYQHGYLGTNRRDLEPIPGFLPLKPYSIHFHSDGGVLAQRPLSIPFNTPDSITIEAPTPREDALLNMLSPFDKLSRLTLLDICPKVPSHLAVKLREIKYLRLRTSRMVPFDIGPLLSPSLEELHVEHSCDNTFLPLTQNQTLPNLHTLGITLHERPLCSMLEFPALRTLLLHSSAPVSDQISTLDFFKSKTHFGSIDRLSFCDWDGAESCITMIEIVKNIVLASPDLTELTFTKCRLEMSDLISVLKSDGFTLKVINLVVCVGITQADCESLRLNVERLTVSI